MAIGIQNLVKYMERRTQNMESPVARSVASKGIRGDTEVGHLERGDIVVPPSMQTPGLIGLLSQKAKQQGYDLSERIVGSPRAERNPTTGAQMFADPKEDFLPPSNVDWGLPWIEQYENGYDPYAERYDWMEDVPPILHWSNFKYNPYNNPGADFSNYGEVGAAQGGGEHVWWGIDPDSPMAEAPPPEEEAPAEADSGLTIEDFLRMNGLGDQHFIAAGLPQYGGDYPGGGSWHIGENTFLTSEGELNERINLQDKWTGSEDQRKILKSINWTPGE